MEKYSIDLFTRLDDFRNTFENDNIYCYQILMLFINEIFIEHEYSEYIYLSLQENLKVTIEMILEFNNINSEKYQEIEKIDISDIHDLLILLNNINYCLNNQESYFLKDNKILEQINYILNILKNDTKSNLELNENNIEFKSESEPEVESEPEFNDLNKLIEVCNNDYLLNKEKYNFNEEYLEEEDRIYEPEEEEFFKETAKRISSINLNNYLNENDFKLNINSIKELILRDEKLKKHYICKKCGINTWNNYPLPLLLKQDKDNNFYFLCPNCNSLFGTDDKND